MTPSLLHWRAAALLIIAALLATSAQAADPIAKQAFGAAKTPTRGVAEIWGSYARGCLAGGIELAATGPTWQAMRPSRNRAYGHPDLIDFVERLSGRVAAIGWPGLLIGDLAQPRGGPMLTGHRSHQIGLDVDIWMRPAPERILTPEEREAMGSFSVVAPGGRDVSANWSAEHAAVLKTAAEDPAVARIFVHAAIKRALCTGPAAAEARQGDRAWLRKIRPWYGHDAHFHVRLSCPKDAKGCVNQAPPPPGDGCDALDWWFSADARTPKPSTAKKKRGPLRLSELPQACGGLAFQ